LPQELAADFQQAETLLLDLHRQGHTDPSIEVCLAKDYLELGLLNPARRLAERVVSETTAGQTPYLGAADVLGQLALRAEDNESALRWYRQLTKLRRVSGDFVLLGMCESNAGNLDAAIAALEQALRIDPTLVPAHEYMARLLYDRGDAQRSELHQQAIRSLRSRALRTQQR
jgi:tetratricopeptide (TPR) repeat protein